MITQYFDTLFVSDGNGGYVLSSGSINGLSIKDGIVPAIVYNLTEGQYISGDAKTILNGIKAYDGDPIPDSGYTLERNGKIISFDFMVPEGIDPYGNQAADRQHFFAYRLTVSDASASDDPIEYTVTFLSNGGNGSMDVQKLLEGESANLNSCAFTRENYEFVGWNTMPDGSGVSYSNGQTVALTGNVALYAQWKRSGNVSPDNSGEGESEVMTEIPATGETVSPMFWMSLIFVSICCFVCVRKKAFLHR